MVASLCPNDGIAELAAVRGSDHGEEASPGAVVGSGDREVVMEAGSAVLRAKSCLQMLPGLMCSPFQQLLAQFSQTTSCLETCVLSQACIAPCQRVWGTVG